MELKEILAISGQPGLYKYVAQSTNGVIVESLLDGRRMNASASSKVSSLTEISMFTEGEDIALADVFTKIYAHTGGKEAISPKEAPEKLKAAFARIRPRPGARIRHEEVLRVVQHSGQGRFYGVQTPVRSRIEKVPLRERDFFVVSGVIPAFFMPPNSRFILSLCNSETNIQATDIMERRTKVLALVAHDNMKHDLAEWVDWNSKKLGRHHLVCTGTTGKMVEKTLRDHREEYEGDEEIEELPDLRITLLKSGPLGGDQQLGSLIADGKIDALIFFWDPMSAQPHDVDVKALLRLATLYNVPTAINRSSADFLISSPLFEDDGYVPVVKDYKAYVERVLK